MPGGDSSGTVEAVTRRTPHTLAGGRRLVMEPVAVQVIAYARAHESGDVDALAALFAGDISVSMPPMARRDTCQWSAGVWGIPSGPLAQRVLHRKQAKMACRTQAVERLRRRDRTDRVPTLVVDTTAHNSGWR
jgi:hypothetical protein